MFCHFYYKIFFISWVLNTKIPKFWNFTEISAKNQGLKSKTQGKNPSFSRIFPRLRDQVMLKIKKACFSYSIILNNDHLLIIVTHHLFRQILYILKYSQTPSFAKEIHLNKSHNKKSKRYPVHLKDIQWILSVGWKVTSRIGPNQFQTLLFDL